MNKIFVQIAVYRDPELVKTIDDCIDKCSDPSRLTFGIVWQHNPADWFDGEFHKYLNDARFTITDVAYNQSKGMCWARSLTQQMYQGETYTLQIDSHHRFAKNWDLFLIDCLNMVDSEKPLMTGYCRAYEAENADYHLSEEPLQMIPTKFSESGTIPFIGTNFNIPNQQTFDKPIPARFVSGHFFFTLGQHCIEYKYDPDLYFAGDEISLSIRSYTLGYDLYHPHKNVIWHDYCSYKRDKHWSDHTTGKQVVNPWHELDSISKKRLRQLLQMEDNGFNLGEYGLGATRSFEEYEAYSGIDFKLRKLHGDALIGLVPPTLKLYDKSWITNPSEFTLPLSDLIKKITLDDIAQYYIGFDDYDNRAVYNERILSNDMAQIKGTKTFSFASSKTPVKAVIFGITKDNKWSDRVEYLL